MLQKFLGIAEIAVSIYFIFRVATHTLTSRDMLIFAAVTFLFCIALAHYNQRTREERSKKRRESAQLKYDKRRANKMREDLEREKVAGVDENGEDEYATHPIRVQEYANKLYSGEINMEDLPDTRSRVARNESGAKAESINEGR